MKVRGLRREIIYHIFSARDAQGADALETVSQRKVIQKSAGLVSTERMLTIADEGGRGMHRQHLALETQTTTTSCGR